MRYTAAMSLVLLYYDWLLTLDDEVRLNFLHLCYFSCLTACSLDSPCLARAPYLAKSNVLHQSISDHCACCLSKLPSVPHFLAGGLER